MIKLWAALIIGMLGLGPTIVHAGQLGPAGEQPPEQRQLLSKDQIRLAQERLQAEGFNPGPVNGELTPQTEEAIRRYQQKQGIPASGALDQATLRDLQLPTSLGGGGGGGR
jgi:peptidoglycan hydrolase-like protein with peptidoglycan-binding domain